jgi:predicted nucleic acid-binding protein
LIVTDASAILEVLLPTDSEQSVKVWLFAAGATLHAPHLMDIEVTQGIRRHTARGEIGNELAQSALDDLPALPIQRYPHGFLLPRVWELRHNLTAYDAVYVALAEMLDATLVTRDVRLANAAGHWARIAVI